MTKIKAPYNFVPLSTKVVYPTWEKAVNHDVPFADGESGTINIKIHTHSPIFVRNGGEVNDGQPSEFFKVNGNYYIPGSSLKGMLRSVVEVMSYSKMQQTNDDKYSVRDFQNNDIYPILDLSKEVKAAWMWKDGDKFYMKDCGAPGRIPHHWIDEAFETKFRSFYKVGGGFKGNNEEHKSAKFKYEKFKNNLEDIRTTGFIEATYGKDNSVDVRKFYKIDPYSKKMGTLVFTGQAGPRKEVPEGGSGKPSGKIHEFIFFETNNKPIEVRNDIINNFFFAYFDQDKNRQSIDWKYWKKKLDNKEKIPVFFRYDNKNQIKDIGLSYLYKIIYEKSVLDSIPEAHKENKHDFSETLFGYIDEKQSLKGRVYIGHAKAINSGKSLGVETSVLSGPKASYYPNYIRQSGKNGITKKYNTFMDDKAVIAGWKRYPVHKNGITSNPGSTDNKKVETSFIPLKEGVEFQFKISVHNLRKIELGALFSAITFHNTPGTFHSIGMAKPLGYGKSSLEITSIEGFENNKEEYMKAFEAYMNYALGNKQTKWNDSEQIIELLTMVSGHDNRGESELAYMKMNPIKRENDFVDAKNRKTGGGEYLDKYSNLVGKEIHAKSLITEGDISKTSINEEKLNKSFQNIDFLKAKENKLAEMKNIVLDEIGSQKDSILSDLERYANEIDPLISSVNKQIKILTAHKGLENFCEMKNNTEINKFKDFENVVRQYLQNAKDLTGSDKLFIEKIITNIYQSATKYEQKQFTKKYKKTIERWLNKQKANQWFNELINS